MLNLSTQQSVVVKQRKEVIEFLGFETRNKYEILSTAGQLLGFAAEQQKSLWGTFLRQIVGHWRSFEIHIFGMDRALRYVARHPFRFYFQRLEIIDTAGRELGFLEKRFSILSKKFSMLDASSSETAQMNSGLFRIWTFPFTRKGEVIAQIEKKWGGAMTEVFLDSDTFLLEFLDPTLTEDQRLVLLSSAIFIDLLYFENNRGFGLMDLIPNS